MVLDGNFKALKLVGFVVIAASGCQTTAPTPGPMGAPSSPQALAIPTTSQEAPPLEQHVAYTANKLRKALGLVSPAPTAYGYGHITPRPSTAPQRIQSPLQVVQFLREAKKNPQLLNALRLTDLNAIYAGATTPERKVMEKAYLEALRLRPQQWILSFRQEDPWVQFQLIPLMGQVGGPAAVGELLWLSQHHNDGLIKAQAENALEGVVN